METRQVVASHPGTIFVSHASRDQDAVYLLARHLVSAMRPMHVYLAEQELALAQIFEEELVDKIWQSTLMVTLWTKDSRSRKWVRFETLLALALGKPVVLIKMDDSPVPSEWAARNYFDAGVYPDANEAFSAFACRLRAETQLRVGAANLVSSAAESKYGFSSDEEDFYRFGSQVLQAARNDSTGTIFMSGSPALILPSETYTAERESYASLLEARIKDPAAMHGAQYLFKYQKTLHAAHREDSGLLRDRLRAIGPTVRRSPARIYGLTRTTAYLPSGILDKEEGALLIRSPTSPSRLIGVYFLKGRQLEHVRRRLFLPNLTPARIKKEATWLAALEQIGDLSGNKRS